VAELVEAAEQAGVETRILRRGDDAAALASAAAQAGTPALGIAGGDGSLAPVAQAALETDRPFVCIPFGTRNHFARDLGLDRDDPLAALAAFRGRERTIDVGTIGARVFLNNVSLGLYASVVHDPEHARRNKTLAALRIIPAALGRSRRPLELVLDVDGRRERRRVLICLVSNNDYRSDRPGDLGRRVRLDEGLLRVYVIEAMRRGALVGLLARAAVGRITAAEGWVERAAATLCVESRRRRVHAAIDGEPVVLRPPLEFELRPSALRVLVPMPANEEDREPAGHAQ
jgi:diacylglycerol kinase family enzyme